MAFIGEPTSTSFLRASLRSFFICGFGLGIGLGDQRAAGVSLSESQVMEYSLALTDAHVDLITGFQVMA